MKKGLKYLFVGIVAVAVSIGARAGDIVVNWNAFQSTGVALSSPTITEVPLGSTIQIGYFTIAPTPGSASLANFVSWATDTINDGFPGYWLSSNTQDEAGTAGGVNGRQIYLVVTGPGNELGIFSSSLPSWKFPTSADLVPTTSIDVNNLVDNAGTAGNSLAASAQIIFGSGPVFNAGDGFSYLKLAVVPEPSTYLLVGMGLLGALAFRRRFKRS